jgi:hypothetical protein
MPTYLSEELPNGLDERYDTRDAEAINAPMPPERKKWLEDRYRAAWHSGGAQAMYSEIENDYGLPKGWMAQMAFIESTGNPNAVSRGNGTFKGLFQLGPQVVKDYGVKDVFDPVENALGAAQYAAYHMKHLPGKVGREVRPFELYMAHQQGMGGYSNLARNPNAKLKDLGTAGQYALNQKVRGITPDSTAGQFTAVFDDRFKRGWGEWAYNPDENIAGFDPTMYAGSWFDPASGTGYYDGAGNFVWEPTPPTPPPSLGVNNFGLGPQPGLHEAVYPGQPANTQYDATYAAAPSFVDNYAAPSPYSVAPPVPSFLSPDYNVGYSSYPGGAYPTSNNSGSPGGGGGGGGGPMVIQVNPSGYGSGG